MDTMLSRALREFFSGPLNQLLVNLAGHEGEIWERELKRFLRKEPTWADTQDSVPEPLPPLLVPGPTASIPVLDRFVVAEMIKPNLGSQAPVNIYDVTDRFQADFYGMEESPWPEVDLYSRQTTRYAPYLQMRKEMGGETMIFRPSLGQVYWLTLQQPNGEAGYLLNNGQVNLFETLNRQGLNRLVRVGWYQGGWVWDSDTVDDAIDLSPGTQVLSRNPH